MDRYTILLAISTLPIKAAVVLCLLRRGREFFVPNFLIVLSALVLTLFVFPPALMLFRMAHAGPPGATPPPIALPARTAASAPWLNRILGPQAIDQSRNPQQRASPSATSFSWW
jgi:hypothetical protein